MASLVFACLFIAGNSPDRQEWPSRWVNHGITREWKSIDSSLSKCRSILVMLVPALSFERAPQNPGNRQTNRQHGYRMPLAHAHRGIKTIDPQCSGVTHIYMYKQRCTTYLTQNIKYLGWLLRQLNVARSLHSRPIHIMRKPQAFNHLCILTLSHIKI